MEPLSPSFRRALRARAHPLHPVVSIGQHGLTPAVLHEIDVALLAHELIKVRVFNDDREVRTALLTGICAALGCAPVQQIGKLLVVWRARPMPETAPPNRPATRRRSADEAQPPIPERPRQGPVTAHASATRNEAAAAKAKARARPPGKAPSGVPRAAAPRRRRGFGNAR